MDELLRELEAMKITGNLLNGNLWKSCVDLTESTFVPERKIGKERPCEEKDYDEYREIIDENLRNIESTLHQVIGTVNDDQNIIEVVFQNHYFRTFLINLITIIGEQSEKSFWNTDESVFIVHNLKSLICNFCKCESISDLLIGQRVGRLNIDNNNILNVVLLKLRPKLLKDTWKIYPAAVNCYKWILWQVEEPNLVYYMNDVIPTALIIMDDYVVENRLIGIRCIERILHHTNMREELINTGYGEVIYDALKKLLILREVAYIIPLYNCMRILLSTSEYYNNTNCLEWTRRDDVMSLLLGNMEFEQNLELRHAYMSSLSGLLTNIGCAKWCERLTRILSEYCEHHTDLKTLKVTMETAKAFLVTFYPRVPTHCVSLYTAFLKIHMDLMETPVFDREIIQNLEDCISLLYKLTPMVGKKIICNDRIKSILHQQSPLTIFNNDTYFE